MAEEKTKIKRKKWVEILAPKVFGDVNVGEILLAEAQDGVGRSVKANLMVLTGDFKKQNIELGLKITGVESGKLVTDIVSYKVMLPSLRRLVRRGKEKLDDSYAFITADNKLVRIKIFMITRYAIKASVLTSLRKTSVLVLTREVKKLTFMNLISSLISNKLQKVLISELTKVYPLKICEIRDVVVEKENVKPSEIAQIEARLTQNKEEKEEDSEEDTEEEKEEEQGKKSKKAPQEIEMEAESAEVQVQEQEVDEDAKAED